jgi:hypothetical protein
LRKYIIALQLILVFSLIYMPSLSTITPSNLALATEGEPTPPSLIYPRIHSPEEVIGRVPDQIVNLVDHRLFARGSHPNEAGAQIIELRGWLRIPQNEIWCHTNSNLTQACINLDEQLPDYAYDLELDPTWLDQNGMDINEIVRVGSLLRQSQETDLSTSADAEIHIELKPWRPGARMDVWPREIAEKYKELLGIDLSQIAQLVPQPSNWDVKVDTDLYGPVFFPWDPRYPSNVDREEDPNGYFRDGEYVRVVGALVTDFPHGRVWKYPYPHIPNYQTDKNNPARWTEIHPIDVIERVDPPRDANGMLHKETVKCVAAVAENGDLGEFTGDTTPFRARIPAPEKPDPLAQLRFIEHIDNTGNTLMHTASRRVDVHSNYIEVSGGVQGEGNLGVYGKFKACYRVFWEPGPPQIRITSIEPAPIMAREPTTVIVRAEDWYNSGTPVDGEVLIDGVGVVGRTNTPFSFTFTSNSTYVTGRLTAQEYADAALTFRLTFPQLEVRAEPSTIQLGNETQVTIYASDPKTHGPVAAEILTDEANGRRPSFGRLIGDTNLPFNHSFNAALVLEDATEEGVVYRYGYPTVTVREPGYETTVVPINFTGTLPDGEVIIRLPRPIDGSEPDIPEDNCPRGIGRCPIDEEMRDGPRPFDLP